MPRGRTQYRARCTNAWLECTGADGRPCWHRESCSRGECRRTPVIIDNSVAVRSPPCLTKVILVAAGEALVQGLRFMRSSRAQWNANPALPSEDQLVRSLKTLLGLLGSLSAGSPFFGPCFSFLSRVLMFIDYWCTESQLTKLNETLSGL